MNEILENLGKGVDVRHQLDKETLIWITSGIFLAIFLGTLLGVLLVKKL